MISLLGRLKDPLSLGMTPATTSPISHPAMVSIIDDLGLSIASDDNDPQFGLTVKEKFIREDVSGWLGLRSPPRLRLKTAGLG